jgi:flagellar hook-associated protein 3 FlgL
MTIATSLFFDRSRDAMTALSSRADTLNTQIATGKKLQAPSDDPLSYAKLRNLATQSADADAYGGNLKIASASLASADTTLSAITAQITQAQTLATQASNGTLSADNRKAIGEQLAGIVQTLASLAGSQDPSGHPLFGDTSGAAAVTQNADGSYALASGTSPSIPIGDGQTVQGSVTASQIFALPGGTNTLKVIGDLAASLQSGTDSGAAASAAIDTLQTAGDQVDIAQASVGARAARVELEQSTQTTAATTRETLRSGLEDTDVTAAITELQKTMTTLQATQASFTKLSSLSLFDYLK